MPSADEIKRAAKRRAGMAEAIARSIRDRGYPPTTRELAAELDVSQRQVRVDLQLLEQCGAIQRDPGVTRGMRVHPERAAV